MIADLHAHYPMRVVDGVDPDTTANLVKQRGGGKLGGLVRRLVLRIANRIGNFPTWDGTYRITPETLRKGEVGLAMSVLYRPFEEMDLSEPYAAPPSPSYFPGLIADLEEVEAEVATHEPDLRLVHDRAELDRALTSGATALVHAVEGGFHLGDTDEEIAANCAELGRRGVAYVTVAHLFFRQVATNANAVPFIPDPVYGFLFPQHGTDRLTPRGEAVVRGLVENRIMVDLSHMDPGGIRETLAFLDEIDPDASVPVLSTHAGYRFGKQEYMHDAETLRQIKRRRGLIGLIMAQHQLNDGLRGKHDETDTLDESMQVIGRHVERIAEITGGYEQIALGSDFDGFVKPTMGGLKDMADLPRLEVALSKRFGADNAERMMWKNALGVLQAIWAEA